MSHPDFAVLTVSWELALRADGYADDTVRAYQKAVRSLAEWLGGHHPEVGPVELDRQHIRGWLVEIRETRSNSTARGWFAGVRHVLPLAAERGETDHDATGSIRTPPPGDPEAAVLSDQELSAFLAGTALMVLLMSVSPAHACSRCPSPSGSLRPRSAPGWRCCSESSI